ncbi:transcription factor S-II, central domain-containing protein [Dipodascopsis uninucleata]
MATPEPRRSSRSTKGQHSQKWSEEMEEVETERTAAKPKSSSLQSPTVNKSFITNKSLTSKSENQKRSTRRATDKGARSNGTDDNSDENVRCVCGLTYSDPDDDKTLMAQCEICLCWQHPECTLGIKDEKDVPEKYFCEECRPDLHGYYFKNLAKVNTAEVVSSPGKVSTTGSERSKDEQNVAEDIPSSKPPTIRKSKKRSISSLSPEPDIGSHEEYNAGRIKHRRSSPVLTPSNSVTASKSRSEGLTDKTMNEEFYDKPSVKSDIADLGHISDLKDNVRKSVATALMSILERGATEAIKQELLTLNENEDEKMFAEQLSLEIEHALYKNLAIRSGKDVGQKYRDKFRTISFNLKDSKNASFRQRVLSREVQAEDIAKMSSEEMMNPELQKLAEAVRQESITQSILKKAELPKIRRTHKGEEFVGDVDGMTTSNEPEPENNFTSRPFLADSRVDIPANIYHPRSPSPRTDDEYYRKSMTPASEEYSRPPTPDIGDIDDGNGSRFGRSESLSSVLVEETSEVSIPPAVSNSKSDFDISSILKSVDSSSIPHVSHERYERPDTEISSASLSPHTRELSKVIDEDIDRLINDDDNAENDEEHDDYSPNFPTSDPVIWDGPMSMLGVATFDAKAIQVGGPLFDGEVRRWEDIISSYIEIDGRLAMDKASSYLQDVSATKDLVAISFNLKNEGNPDQEREFLQLFDYFRSRERYGVIRNKFPNVKDAYLVPLLPADKRPYYMDMISSSSIPKIITTKMLLGIFVVNKVVFTGANYGTEQLPSSLMEYDPTVPLNTGVMRTFSLATQQQVPQQTQLHKHPELYDSMTVETISEMAKIGNIIQNLGLPKKETAMLEVIAKGNPEVMANPSLLSDPQFLINLVQKNQHRLG